MSRVWFFATIIVITAATFQILQLKREQSSRKEWIVLMALYALIFVGIVLCAIELDSPIPRLIEWMTPFTQHIYRIIG